MSLTTPIRRPLLFATATLCALGSASGALAAQASAATITANQPCYVIADPATGAPMTISGAGFTPGDTVDVSGGTVFAEAPVAANGTFAVTTEAPILPTIDPATQSTTITAQGLDGVTAATTVMSANLAVSVNPSSVRHPDRTKVKFEFSGFTPGKNIYAYYLHNKKLVARARFGKAAGPCGTLQHKALMYPGGHPRSDQYKVTFETSTRYVKNAFPQVVQKLLVLHF